jgi:hypothetical protein
MAGGPAETLIGVTVLGMGSLLGYAAYRDVPVFGPEGLLTGALRTGKLQPVSAKQAKAQTSAAQKAGGNEPWWYRLLHVPGFPLSGDPIP